MNRILLYTPTFGPPETAQVSLGYHQAMCAYLRDAAVVEVDGRMFTDCDLVRARSRAIRVALQDSECTHLLSWDSDVCGNVETVTKCLTGMLSSGHEYVGAPYPKKKTRWTRIAAGVAAGARTPDDLEALAYDYPYAIIDSEERSDIQVERGCVQVDWLAAGFTLIARTCMQRMWDAYQSSLSFGDRIDDQLDWTVALYMPLILGQQRATAPYNVDPLLSEDYSFCQRWRDIGGKVHMYVAEGSPLHHIGPHLYRGLPAGMAYQASAAVAT